MRLIVYFIVVLLFFLSLASHAETLRVMLYDTNNPPYSFKKEGQHQGIFIDIFKQLEKISPYKFILIDYPFARAQHEFFLGNVDIEPGIFDGWRINEKIYGQYSITFAKAEDVIVFRKGMAFSVQTPKNLFGKMVGTVRGYTYGEYDHPEVLRQDNKDEGLILKQLLYQRFNQIFIDKRVIKYYMLKDKTYRQLEIGDTLLSVDVALRVHPNKVHTLPALNTALQKMLTTGKMEQIYQKYQLPVTE
jgi:polar amino acid transport system substrate-binding protein